MQHSNALATPEIVPAPAGFIAPVTHIGESKTARATHAFLSRYSGSTLRSYTQDLNIFFAWCSAAGVKPMKVTRAELDYYSTYLLEQRGNAPASVNRRLTAVKGFYRLAVADDLVRKDPTLTLRMHKIHIDPSKYIGLSRIQVGAMLQTARATSATDAALMSLMSFLALRVSEACSIQIEDFRGPELREHRVVHFIGKGKKPATMPIPVPLWRDLLAAAGDRTEGPLILRRDGKQMDRRTAYRRTQSVAKRAGIEEAIWPHVLRHSAITAALDAGVHLRDVQAFARHASILTTMRYDRGRRDLDQHASYALAAFFTGVA